MLKRIDAIAERQTKRDEADKADRAAAEAGRREAYLEEQSRLMKTAHPDYVAVTALPAFSEWLDQQPRYVQEAVDRNAKAIEDAKLLHRQPLQSLPVRRATPCASGPSREWRQTAGRREGKHRKPVRQAQSPTRRLHISPLTWSRSRSGHS